jgi:quinol-cytochrome oxidoreductase complex cytochrome b subunit
MVKIGPWRSLRFFVCKSGFLAFLAFLVLFLPFFGLDTESVSNISDTIALHF